MKKETLRILEFDRVLGAVAAYARSEPSERMVLGIRPLPGRREIEERLGAVGDIRRLSEEGDPLGVSPFRDIEGVLEEVRPENAVLEPDALLAVRSVLRVLAAVSAQLSGREDLRRLSSLAEGLTGFPELLEAIERSIDAEGHILDGASFELSEIRGRIRALDRRITRRLEEIVRDRDISPFLQDEFITKRSGRWVIPVRMDAKGQVQGVVHDVSRSGETAFVEPLEIIGLANELENLVAEEKTEVIRILRAISRDVREMGGELAGQFGKLVYLDALNAVALFSDSLRMRAPGLSEGPEIRLEGASHPLLLMFKRDGVVPLDLALGGEGRVMAITGPNAGGKTIAIKTAGLLTLMALSGMPVPAGESSVFPLVQDVLVDIGDEQSIESSLSTFSAHVANISDIIGRAGPGTLALIDELGTGTDPLQGAAIGCAVLSELKEKGSMVLCTTHLTDIVGYVHRQEGMVNASMEFDAETLTPLYRLKVGEPGQSHALEIAEKFGLPGRTIQRAKELMGSAEAEFHSLMADLKQKRMEYEAALDALEEQRAALEAESARLRDRLKEAERKRNGILEEAYREARELVSRVKREAYAALEEARRQKSKAALRKLEEERRELEEKLRALSPEPSLGIGEIKEGDIVHVKSAGLEAEVAGRDLRRGRVRLKAGAKELEVPISDIAPARGKAARQPGVSFEGETEEAVPSRISLVGLRVEEALRRLEPFLNHASLAGLNEVIVVHGIGTGALRRAVREHLDGHPLLEGFRGGEQQEGGEGVTIVRLR